MRMSFTFSSLANSLVSPIAHSPASQPLSKPHCPQWSPLRDAAQHRNTAFASTARFFLLLESAPWLQGLAPLSSRHFFSSISKFGMIFSRPFGGHNTTTKCFCRLMSHTCPHTPAFRNVSELKGAFPKPARSLAHSPHSISKHLTWHCDRR